MQGGLILSGAPPLRHPCLVETALTPPEICTAAVRNNKCVMHWNYSFPKRVLSEDHEDRYRINKIFIHRIISSRRVNVIRRVRKKQLGEPRCREQFAIPTQNAKKLTGGSESNDPRKPSESCEGLVPRGRRMEPNRLTHRNVFCDDSTPPSSLEESQSGIFREKCVGTAVLVFLGCLGVNKGLGQPGDHTGVVLSFAFAVFIAVQVIGAPLLRTGSTGHPDPT